MKFKRVGYNKIGGTCLQGYIDVEYDRLVEVFGAPLGGDKYKTDAEWVIEFADGTVATIYNYKDGVSYLGESEGLKADDITDWHIGGFDRNAVALVHDALGLQ